MPFFMIDDQLPANAKAQTLIRTAIRGDLIGPAALGLWAMAGAASQAKLSDGVVTLEDLISLLLSGDVAQQLASQLVDVGLWHDENHSCDRCPEVQPGTYLFHDWFALNYARSDTVKVKRDKGKELKSPELIAKVWWRDCTDDPDNPTRGRCRYCAREVLRSDRKSDTRPTLDHVDPRKAAGHQNVVLACFDCNRRKAARTPEQAGMALLPAPPRGSTSTPSSISPRSAVAENETPTSPPTGAAEVRSPLSPLTVVAETEDRVEDPIKQPDQTDIRQISARKSEPESEMKRVLGRAHDHTRAGRAGSGVGLGTSSTGSPALKPATPKPRNRRRGRARQKPAGTPDQPEDPHHAGDAPDVPAVGLHGSPWHGWQGRRSGIEETTCELHHEEQPCRHCLKESE